MSFGYIGDISTKIKQQVKNEGILSVTELLELEKDGFLGGSLELIAESNYSSGVSTVDFLSIKEDVYDVHLFTFKNCTATGNSNLRVQLYESGVLETASVYKRALQTQTTSGGTEARSTGVNPITIVNFASTASTRVGNGYIYFYNLGNSNAFSYLTFQVYGGHTEEQFSFGSASLPQASTVDGIRFLAGAGSDTFSQFNFKLYGVKQL
jgi:hypothetical protein